jgi:hypothetical protein
MRVVVWGGSYQANFADDKKTTVSSEFAEDKKTAVLRREFTIFRQEQYILIAH